MWVIKPTVGNPSSTAPVAARQSQSVLWEKGTCIPFPYGKEAGWTMGLLTCLPAILPVEQLEPLCSAVWLNMEDKILW